MTEAKTLPSLVELPKPRFRHLLGIELLEAWEIWSFLLAASQEQIFGNISELWSH